VVVVPAAKAEEVAEHAWRHAKRDKEKRRSLYAEAGLPEDWTVT
jgi:hypothetical protein